MEERKVQKSFLIDFLRVIASFGVVWLHVNSGIWTFVPSKSWAFGWAIETFLYWPVPIFCMISGITLMDYRERYSTATFLKKRLLRTVIPFLIWSVVAIFWSIYVSGYLPIDTRFDWRNIIDLIINCKALSIYWFFPVLFTLYLSIPVLSAIPKEMRKNVFSYGIIYAMLSISLPQFLWGIKQVPFNGELSTVVCGGYVMYLLMGYLIYNYEIPKKWRVVIYVVGCVGWFVRFYFGLRRSFTIGNVDGTFGGYQNLPGVVWSMAVFTFFRYCSLDKIANSAIGRGITFMAKYSFDIYLVHIYVMWHIVDIFHINMMLVSWKLYGVVVVYAISFVLVVLLKKIPFVEKILP